jgi:hypothetical protein
LLARKNRPGRPAPEYPDGHDSCESELDGSVEQVDAPNPAVEAEATAMLASASATPNANGMIERPFT